MIRSLFRTLEASIHERLNMIEDVIRLSGGDDATRLFGVEDAAPAPAMQANHEPYLERIRSLEDEVQTLSARLAALEQTGVEVPEASAPAVHVHQEGKNSLWIEPMRDLAIELPALSVPKSSPVLVAAAPPPAPVPAPAKPANTLVAVKEEEVEEVAEEEVAEEEVAEEEVAEEEVAEEGEAEEGEAEEGEAEEEAEEGEAEEEAEGIEIEEFEYKGKTYYRDPENQVYRMVDDELDETPIGTWDPTRQRILFRRPTSA